MVEILSPERHSSLTAVGINELARGEIASEEQQVVESILSDRANLLGPFSRLGWTDEVQDWIQDEVGHEIVFTGEIRQYNVARNFELARFLTRDGPAYWLKATGQPNVHEFSITRVLSELSPQYLPRRIGERADWNAWVMEDAGESLDSWTSFEFETAVVSMATLQKTTIGKTEELMKAGAANQRIAVLRTHLDEVFEYLMEAMSAQTSVRVPRVETDRIRQIAFVLQDACLHMENLRIPDTLIHNDMNSGNILFQGTRSIFTDWCEAGIGNPFFTTQYLCLLQPRGKQNLQALPEVWKQCWGDFLSAQQIEQALALTPLLAIFSYLYGRGTWLSSPQRNSYHIQAHARSLARHMDRAARSPKFLEALCQ
jgi:hypothetical protein